MKTAKKIFALVMSVILCFGIVTSTTLAWLTDRDSAANVFTVGDVRIDLNEEFDQGSQLLPGLDILKKPTITNTGINDAWVWAAVAVPVLLDDEENASENILHFNYDANFVNGTEWTWKDTNDNWMVQTNVTINKRLYNVYHVLYQTPLKPGETTSPVITNVYMDTHVDIDPEGNAFYVKDGQTTDLNWNVKDYNAPTIYVSAYAIQKETFDDVRTAFAAYQAQWGDNGVEWAAPAKLISTYKELATAQHSEGAYILTNDIESDGTANFNGDLSLDYPNKEFVLHLNGYSIERSSVNPGQSALNVNRTNMTINGNGYVTSQASLALCNFAGNLVLNGVNVSVGAGTNVAVSNAGNTIINGGKFSAENGVIFQSGVYGGEVRVLTINDATVLNSGVTVFSAYGGKIVINGGNYSGSVEMFAVAKNGEIVINGGTFNQDPAAYVAAGHTAVNNGDGTWTVN